MGNVALPTLSESVDRPKRNPIVAGVSAGVDELQALGGSAIAATGKLLNAPTIERLGSDINARNVVEASKSGRPDLERMPWEQGGPSLGQTPAWLAYQVAKQAPQIGATLLASRFVPRGLVGQELTRVGATVPAALGGGGMAARIAAAGTEAGAQFAARRAALQAGEEFARTTVAGVATGMPLAVGSMYQEAASKPGGATREDAAAAFAMSPFYAALDAVGTPTQLGAIRRGLASGNLLKRVATAGAVGAVSEMPQEAAQTAMELSFRPDMAPAEKSRQIINAALVGGAVGGVFGSFGGVRRLQSEAPNAVDNNSLVGSIDEVLSNQQTAPQRKSTETVRDQAISNIEQFGSTEAASAAFTGVDDIQLRRLAAQAQAKINNKEEVEKYQPLLAAIEAETVRRATGAGADVAAQQAGSGQMELPFGETPQPLTPEQRVGAMRTLATQIAGKSNQYIAKLNAEDEVALLDKALKDLEGRSTSKTAEKIAQHFGVIDEQGKPRDLAGEVATAQEELQAAQSATLFPEGDPQVEAAQQRFDDLNAKLQVVTALQERRAGGTNAVQVGSTEGLDVRQPAKTGEGVAEGNAQGSQAATQGQAEVQLTPELLRSNTQMFATAEANRRNLDTGMFGMAAKDVIDGRTPLTDAQILEKQGPGELEAYKAGLAWAQEKLTPQAAPKMTQADRQFQQFQSELKAQQDNYKGETEGTKEPAPVYKVKAVGKPTNTQKGAPRYTPMRLNDGTEVQIYSVTRAEEGTGKKAGQKAQRTTWYVRDPAYGIEAQPIFTEMATAAATRQRALSGAQDVVNRVRTEKYAGYGQTAEAELTDKPAQLQAVLERIALRDKPADIEAAIEAARQAPTLTEPTVTEVAPFEGAAPLRGQPQFVEMNTPEPGPKKAEMRAETKRVIMQAIDDAYQAGKENEPGGITRLEQLNLINLVRDPANYKRIQKFLQSRVSYSEGRGGTGIEPEGLRSAVAQIVAKWRANRNVTVVGSFTELPEELQFRLIMDRATNARGVVTKGGAIYLLAHNLDSVEEGVATLYHENLGHVGLAGMFRKRLDATLAQLYKSNANLRAATDQWRAEHPNAYRNDPNRLARSVEEVLARQSEAGQIEASIFVKIKAVVKLLANKIGWRTELTDNDINAILAMAHNRATLGSYSDRAVRGVRYMFVGQNALMADQHQLTKAIAMEKLGADARPGGEVQQQTGWFRSFDSEWRFEISDRGAAFTQAWQDLPISMDRGLPLHEVLDHPTLYNQYPMMRDIMVYKIRNLQTILSGLHGSYDEENGKLYISADSREQLPTMLHELQHGIQGMEGFGRGGNTRTALNKASLPQLERMRDDLTSTLSPKIMKLVSRIQMLERMQNLPMAAEYTRVGKLASELFDQRGNTDLWDSELRAKWNAAYTQRINLKAQIFQALAGVDTFNDLPDSMQDDVAQGLLRLENGTISDAIGKARAERHNLAEKLSAFTKPQTEDDLRDMLAKSGAGTTAYMRLAGEMEAREVERRMEFDDEERRMDAAYSQATVAPEDVIVAMELPDEDVSERRNPTPGEANTRAEAVASQGTRVFDNLDRRPTISNALQETLLGWSSVTHMGSRYRSLFQNGADNGLTDYISAEDERAAINARLSQLYTNLEIEFDRLQRTQPKMAEKVGELMSATEFEIDPRKSWERHDWLHGKPNEAHLMQLVADANNTYRELVRAGHADLYENFIATNEAMHYAMMSVSLHNMVVSDPMVRRDAVAEFDMNPMDQFMSQSALHEKPQNARDYWKGVLDTQVNAVKRYVEVEGILANDPNLTEKQRAEIASKISPLERRLKSINQSVAAMEQSPYFHLGRFGQYFVAFSTKKTEDGSTNPEAMDKVARALEKAGITHVRISPETERRNVFMRFDSIEQQERAKEVVHQLMTAGLVESEGKSEPKAGSVKNEEDIAQLDQPMWLDRYIQTLQASDAFEPDVRARMVANAREVWLDMLPDTALSKVMVHREAVPGYDADMIRNFAHRMRVGATALSNLSTASKVTKAFTEMRQVVQDSKKLSNPKHKDNLTIQNVFSELSQRVSQRADQIESPVIDRLVATNHAYFLGMSPSYVLTNLTQLGTLLWPELTKQKGVGFVDAAKAIAKVTPIAFKIMKATFSEGAKLGARRAADAIITEDALKKAGISEADAKFVMDMVNTGTIDIGNASRELGRAAEGKTDSKTDLVLRYASAAGYYSETFSRLVAALSARETYQGDPAKMQAYAKDVVTEAMLNYSTWNRGRMTGKTGIFGRMTPVVMAFMTYQFQVIEKMYRELYTAFSKNASLDERQAARRFLMGHATAMVVLAGSLGLPMASVAARAVEALVDLGDDDDEPYDAKAAWMNFLTDVMGKDAGLMIARGVLPRMAGIDISQRVGEADIIPFSKLLTDRRTWKDASKDYINQSAGAPFSMISNIISGGGKMMDGDVIGGMQEAVPVALKGPASAWRMAEDGQYVDSQGKPLPGITPGAGNIIAQVLGFVPAEKADVQEAKRQQTVRKGQIMQTASNIRKQLINALESGDREKAREWLQEMRSFDRQFPAYAVGPRISSVITQRRKQQQRYTAGGVPVGANPKDVEARALTRWNQPD